MASAGLTKIKSGGKTIMARNGLAISTKTHPLSPEQVGRPIKKAANTAKVQQRLKNFKEVSKAKQSLFKKSPEMTGRRDGDIGRAYQGNIKPQRVIPKGTGKRKPRPWAAAKPIARKKAS